MIGIPSRSYRTKLTTCLVLLAMLAVQLVGLAPTPAAAQSLTYVRLKNKWQNTYLYESANQVKYGTPAVSDTSSQWLIEDFEGSKRIKNRATGNYMAIEHLYDYVESIAADSSWMSARWTIEDAPAAGYKVIRNVWHTWQVLHMENLRGYAQYGEINTSFDSPQWLIETVGSGATATPTSAPTSAPTATPTKTAAPTTVPTSGPTAVPTQTAVPTATPIPGTSTNLALNKPITASSSIYTFVAANANDGSTATYWEGGSSPSSLTVDLGANANITSLVLKLNPDTAWSTRTQTIQVLGHDQNSTSFSSLVGAATYSFNPATGNSVTINLSATVSAVQLNITSNSGAPAGQVAELQVMGTMAPNPDLTITGLTWTPSAPTETSAITLAATVKNAGDAASSATTVSFSLNGTTAGSASVGALAAGASTTVSLNIGTRGMGSYTVAATVDPSNTVVEKSNDNNAFAAALAVAQSPGPDLQVLGVAMTPDSPTAGTAVSFVVSVNNRGTAAVAAGTTTRVVVGGTTLSSTSTPAIAAGATVNVTVGTWTAVDGSTAITASTDASNIIAETNESNNALSQSVAVGRGAIMPYTHIEAESASVATNGTRLTPNFQLADFAGEASGRSAVLLDATGEYVEFTLPAAANAIVVRNAIPNSADGAGLDATLSVYAAGSDKGNLTVSSKFSYVYASPSTLGNLGYSNTPGGTAYWLYEEAHMLLDQVYPAGTKLRLQKDAGDVQWVYVDFLEAENVAPAASNPDPTRYVEVSASKSIDAALQEFRADTNKLGIFIPAGTWVLENKIYVYGRATQIIGAGPWHTQLTAPQGSSNTDVGFNIASTANGSVIKNFSVWGNYRYRVDGPGKFIDGNGMQNVTVDNVWAEHFICFYWGVAASNNTFKNLRIRNTFADGINMTNGSNNNLITNSDARGTGDDSFALFSAVDAGGSYNTGNVYSNLTATLVRRAAAFAVYGGAGNLYKNLYGADTLTYPGITISSLSFGYNTLGFGDTDNVFDGVTLDRTGGDFWGSAGSDDHINDYQNFAAIWFFAGDRPFQNILVKNVDINNPVYFGVMFQTKYPEKNAMKNVRLENVNINGATRYGIKLVIRAEGTSDTPPVGSVSFTNVKVINSGIAAFYGEGRAPEFLVNRVSGNNW